MRRKAASGKKKSYYSTRKGVKMDRALLEMAEGFGEKGKIGVADARKLVVRSNHATPSLHAAGHELTMPHRRSMGCAGAGAPGGAVA